MIGEIRRDVSTTLYGAIATIGGDPALRTDRQTAWLRWLERMIDGTKDDHENIFWILVREFMLDEPGSPGVLLDGRLANILNREYAGKLVLHNFEFVSYGSIVVWRIL